MPRVYIAGPMRGHAKFNFPAFDRAAALGRSLGWQVISPADLDRESGIHEDTVVEATPAMAREFVKRDTHALLSLLAENGDAIAMLHGWPMSTGARAELGIATWLGLRILDARSFTNINAKLMGYVETDLPSFCGMGGCETGAGRFDEMESMKRIAEEIANRKVV